MVTKKLFALASVTALTGLMATIAASGCSSTTVEAAGTTPDAANAQETGKKPTEAGPKPGDDEEEAPSTECKGTAIAVDLTTLPWKAPNQEMGSCSEKELTDLVNYVDMNSSAKYADWKKTVANATCSACIFGKESETKWKPLLEDAKGQLVELNVGGCIQIARAQGGASAADAEKCGKSYQNWFDCRFEACSDCPDGDSAALQKCLSAASKGACKKAFDAVGTECTDEGIGDAETACTGDKFVFEGPIRAQCIGLGGEGGGG